MRPRLGLGVVTGAALLACSAWGSAPVAVRAQTAGGAPTGIELVDSRILREHLPSKAASETMTLINHEAAPITLDLGMTGLAHDLDGTVECRAIDNPALSVSVPQVTLAPGERKNVQVTGRIPAGVGGVYEGFTATVVPAGAPAGQVVIRQRLCGQLLLRGPQPWKETVAIETAEATDRTITAVVRATGDVHVQPSGTAKVLHDGVVLATVQLASHFILPGSARRLSGSWKAPAGLTGPVEIQVTLKDPRATGSGTTTFTNGKPAGAASGTTTTAGDSTSTTVVGPPPASGGNVDGRPRRHRAASWLALLILVAVVLALAALLATVVARRRRQLAALSAAVAALSGRVPTASETELLSIESEASEIEHEARALGVLGTWPAARVVTAAEAVRVAARGARVG